MSWIDVGGCRPFPLQVSDRTDGDFGPRHHGGPFAALIGDDDDRLVARTSTLSVSSAFDISAGDAKEARFRDQALMGPDGRDDGALDGD